MQTYSVYVHTYMYTVHAIGMPATKTFKSTQKALITVVVCTCICNENVTC